MKLEFPLLKWYICVEKFNVRVLRVLFPKEFLVEARIC